MTGALSKEAAATSFFWCKLLRAAGGTDAVIIDVDRRKRVRASDPGYELRRRGGAVVFVIPKRAVRSSQDEIKVAILLDIAKCRSVACSRFDTGKGI